MRDDGVAGEAHQDGDDADAQEWTEETPGGQPADEERYTILKEERVRERKYYKFRYIHMRLHIF